MAMLRSNAWLVVTQVKGKQILSSNFYASELTFMYFDSFTSVVLSVHNLVVYANLMLCNSNAL